jgi:recombination protein U
MREFEAQDGVAFFLIFFTRENLFYYLPFRHFLPFWERAQTGGRRSFRLDELDMTYVIPDEQGLMVPYLDMVNKDLLERE